MKFNKRDYAILKTVNGVDILHLRAAEDKDLCFIHRDKAFRHFANAEQAEKFIKNGRR